MALRTAVELDPSGVVSGAAKVKSALQGVDRELSKTERLTYAAEDAVDAYAASQIKLGRAINDANQVTNQHGKVLVGATKEYNRLQHQVELAAKGVQDFEKRGGNATGTINQMSYQVQDFAMQVQSGGNAMQAATMQGSAMVAAINPIAGAVVGIAGAIGMALVPSLFESGKAAKDLEMYLDGATHAMELNSDGSFTLSEDLAKLTKVNDRLGDSFLRTTRLQAELAASASNKAALETIGDTTDSFLYGDNIGAIKALTGQVKFTRENNQALSTFTKTMQDAKATGKLTTEQTLALKDAMLLLKPTTDDARAAQVAINRALDSNIIAQEDLTRIMELSNKTTKELNESDQNSVVIDERKKAAKEALVTATRAQAAANKELLAIDRETIQMVAEDEQHTMKVNAQVQQIEFGTMSPLEQLEQKEQQKLDIMQTYRDLDVANEEHYQQLVTAVTMKGEQDRAKLMTTSHQKELQIAGNAFDSLSSMAAQFAGDQESRNKTAFALQKGFALASAGVNLGLAISQALALPSDVTIWQKLASGAAIASAAGAAVSTITQTNYATGGYVSGEGTGQSDSINARLGAGEFVMNARATARNRGTLEAMNSGSLSGVPNGGTPVVNLTVVNNVSDAEVTQGVDANGDIELRIDKQISKRVPKMIGDEISNPSSDANRALKSQYRMQRA